MNFSQFSQNNFIKFTVTKNLIPIPMDYKREIIMSKGNNENGQLKKQIRGVSFLFICFVLGFLVTFTIVKFL